MFVSQMVAAQQYGVQGRTDDNIFNTTQTHYQQPEEEQPVRKRNKSLGSRPQQLSILLHQELPQIEESPTINSYRKHMIQVKIQKFKTSKAGTQLCHQSINIYNSLKKELTSSRKLDMIHQTTSQSHRPSLHIPEIGLVPLGSSKFKKRFRTRTDPKCKTQPSQGQSEINSIKKKSIGIKIMPQLRPLQIKSLKKYNQLSLGEIVEDDSAKKYLNFFMKLSDIRSQQQKNTKKDSRRPSDDYSVSGW